MILSKITKWPDGNFNQSFCALRGQFYSSLSVHYFFHVLLTLRPKSYIVVTCTKLSSFFFHLTLLSLSSDLFVHWMKEIIKKESSYPAALSPNNLRFTKRWKRNLFNTRPSQCWSLFVSCKETALRKLILLKQYKTNLTLCFETDSAPLRQCRVTLWGVCYCYQ